MELDKLRECIMEYIEERPNLLGTDGKFTTEDGRQYYWKIERKEVKR